MTAPLTQTPTHPHPTPSHSVWKTDFSIQDPPLQATNKAHVLNSTALLAPPLLAMLYIYSTCTHTHTHIHTDTTKPWADLISGCLSPFMCA